MKTHYNQEKVKEKNPPQQGGGKRRGKTVLVPGSYANAIRNPLPPGRGRELSHIRPSNDEGTIFSL